MLLDVDSIADFAQYYGESLCKGREHGEIFKLINSGRENGPITFTRYVNGKNSGNVAVATLQDLPKYISFGLPKLGMVAFKNELLFFYNTTERSGRRGICPSRILFRSHNSADIVAAGMEYFDRALISKPGVAYKIVYPEYTDLKTAVLHLYVETPPKIAYALSRSVGVYLDSETGITVCYKDTKVGTAKINGITTIIVLNKQHAGLRDQIIRELNCTVEVD
jgi:hypothetical protein